MDNDTLSEHPPTVITRDGARQSGLRYYYTDTPCCNGHLSYRYVCNNRCVQCQKEKSAIVRATPENKAYQKAYNLSRGDAYKERKKQLRKNRPRPKPKPQSAEQIEKRRAASREYMRKKRLDPEHAKLLNEKTQKWRAKNKEKLRDYERRRYAGGKSYQHTAQGAVSMLARVRNRRAIQRAAEGHHTATDIQDIHKLQRGRCAICREKLNGRYHVDHIRPLAKGGGNARSNLQLACGPCNQAKHAKDPIEFMQSLGKLL